MDMLRNTTGELNEFWHICVSYWNQSLFSQYVYAKVPYGEFFMSSANAAVHIKATEQLFVTAIFTLYDHIS